MTRNLMNMLVVLVLVISGGLFVAWKSLLVSSEEGIFIFSVIFGTLATVHSIYAFIHGEIAAKGVLINREKHSFLFYVTILVNVLLVFYCFYISYECYMLLE